jgi:hypothetical protein
MWKGYCKTTRPHCNSRPLHNLYVVQVFIGAFPYQWFRYTLLVPTVARVHILHLKPLVCIPISTGSTWDIGTKNRYYVIPQGFGSQMCTLTIPTICTIDTVTKVVSRIKQWCDSRANKGPILKIILK